MRSHEISEADAPSGDTPPSSLTRDSTVRVMDKAKASSTYIKMVFFFTGNTSLVE